MPRLSLALLGPPRILLDGAEVVDFGYAKVRAPLIYLAAEPGRALAPDEAVALALG